MRNNCKSTHKSACNAMHLHLQNSRVCVLAFLDTQLQIASRAWQTAVTVAHSAWFPHGLISRTGSKMAYHRSQRLSWKLCNVQEHQSDTEISFFLLHVSIGILTCPEQLAGDDCAVPCDVRNTGNVLPSLVTPVRYNGRWISVQYANTGQNVWLALTTCTDCDTSCLWISLKLNLLSGVSLGIWQLHRNIVFRAD